MKEISDRRSIRKYKEIKIDQEKIVQILRAAMQAPSAANQQPWEFIVVDDRVLLSKLSQVSPYAGMIKDASHAIVILGNEERMKFKEYWEQDLSAAVQNILLEVTHLNLGAVWLGIAPLEERMNFISKLFSLPSNVKPFAIVPLGVPENDNQFIDRYDDSRVKYNSYNEEK